MAEARVSVEHPAAGSPAPPADLPAVNQVRMAVETANGKQWPDLFRYGVMEFPIRPAWERSTDPAPQLRLLDAMLTPEEAPGPGAGERQAAAPRTEARPATSLAPRLPVTGVPAIEPGPVKLAPSFQPVTAAPTQVRLPRPEAMPLRPPVAFTRQQTITEAPAKAAPPQVVRTAEPLRAPAAVRPAILAPSVRPAPPVSPTPPPSRAAPVRPSPAPVVTVRAADEAVAAALAAPAPVRVQPKPAAPPPQAVATAPAAASVATPPASKAEPPKPSATAEATTDRAAKPETKAPEPIETEFHLGVAESRSPVLKIALILAIVFVLVIAVYFTTGRKQANRDNGEMAESLMVVGAGWNSDMAQDETGSKALRQFSLYRPTMRLSNYRVAFTGEIERRALGWVFRVADLRNYYGMKVAVSGGKTTLVRYAMIDGVETGRAEIPISARVQLGGTVGIKLDVSGIRFTTYVQGEAADFWTDDQIRTGGFGFANERDERAKITSIQISMLRGAGK